MGQHVRGGIDPEAQEQETGGSQTDPYRLRGVPAEAPPDHGVTGQQTQGGHHHARGTEGPCGGFPQQHSGDVGRRTGHQAEAERGAGAMATHRQSQREGARSDVRSEVGHIGMEPGGREETPPLPSLPNRPDIDPGGGPEGRGQQGMQQAQDDDPQQHRRVPGQGPVAVGFGGRRTLPFESTVLVPVFADHLPGPFQNLGLHA